MGSRASAAVVAALLAAGCGEAADPLARGDALWADSQYGAALAEYRLASQRARGDAVVRLRVAHAYARTGRAERATASYAALLREAPEWQDQAVFDLVRLARDAARRGNAQALADAAAGVLALNPQQPLPRLQHTLARQAMQSGDRERALAFLQGAIANAPNDSLPELWLLAGRLREELGACDAAARFYRDYLSSQPAGAAADDVRWRLGNCAFASAREHARAGFSGEALERYGTVVRLGVPQNLVDQAWVERGELFLSLGRTDSAREAFLRVVELGRGRAAPQVLQRAEARLREMGVEPSWWQSFPPDPDSVQSVAGPS